MNLDTMLSKPGIYAIADFHVIFFVEVLPGGECHQLKPDTFERDGVLKREGWNLRGDEQIFGPLARPAGSPPEPGTWPIAKLTVREDTEQVSAVLYAPGLPPGEFDVFLEPDGNRWKAEAEESAALRDKLSGILTATANAIKGQPEPLTLHSWHDLAESAQALRADAQRLDWLERNPRLAEIVIDGKATDCYLYAVTGAPGLKLREIIDAMMKAEKG